MAAPNPLYDGPVLPETDLLFTARPNSDCRQIKDYILSYLPARCVAPEQALESPKLQLARFNGARYWISMTCKEVDRHHDLVFRQAVVNELVRSIYSTLNPNGAAGRPQFQYLKTMVKLDAVGVPYTWEPTVKVTMWLIET